MRRLSRAVRDVPENTITSFTTAIDWMLTDDAKLLRRNVGAREKTV
jgi:hypothetical protein